VVKVRVVDVDIARSRIGLSMRREPAGEGGASAGARTRAGDARNAGRRPEQPPSPKEEATGALGAALMNSLKRL
jgi:protein Tex